MKIKRARIQNFRSLREVDIEFDATTCFIGPTGAGKSTVLRALDWFFNGEKTLSLDEHDLHSAADSRRITVEVEFNDLTEYDRGVLGSYAPPESDTVIVWRTWEDGEDKISGRALAFPPFEAVRAVPTAMAKRKAYGELREQQPDLELPSVGSEAAVMEALLTWEREHRDRLVPTERNGTHFFGFAGQSKLAELIDFVFVSADLRAAEEADDQKASALGRILDYAVNRTQEIEALSELEKTAHAERLKIQNEAYKPVLDRISGALSRELAQFTTGRGIALAPVVHTPKPARTSFKVSVWDGAAETSVSRQGHGFQRALIIAALKLLAETRRPSQETRTLCLAIEEPELFQHPAQARIFADVLRNLATAEGSRVQVTYATHSTVFVDHRAFHQVRRLRRDFVDNHPTTHTSQVTVDDLCEALAGYVKPDSVRRHAGLRCTDTLAEGFFALAAILVEGDTDAGLITGCAQNMNLGLAAQGVSVIHVNGKNNLILCHAILTALGVPCYVVFDGDCGMADRKLASIQGREGDDDYLQAKKKITTAADDAARMNVDLLGYLGARKRVPWATSTYTVFDDNLEEYLKGAWPAWSRRIKQLIDSGDGFPGKNAPTYREAASSAEGNPPSLLVELLANVQELLKSNTPPADHILPRQPGPQAPVEAAGISGASRVGR
ncbi:ATP-dependent endonuclease [Kitasatospora sp. NPDC048407]|uniref:ATP-dependent nuclease n=1 Tax=Kitasatospora sp. NPDC048407 TaxID=3364051 RepID=UPI003712AAEB